MPKMSYCNVLRVEHLKTGKKKKLELYMIIWELDFLQKHLGGVAFFCVWKE